MASAKTNLHVPLPAELNQKLRAEARRSGQPATEIAREGIRVFLESRRRQAIREEIKAYAHKIAGSRDDLDIEMESAAIEHMLESEEAS
jgi:hypothetical protein